MGRTEGPNLLRHDGYAIIGSQKAGYRSVIVVQTSYKTEASYGEELLQYQRELENCSWSIVGFVQNC
jgi:hypothetical protein